MTKNKPKVAFIHPDLGLGGAERLVVDAAVGLQNLNYDVTIYTSRFCKDRCFVETSDGTLKVIEYGNWLPRHCFGMFHIWFAWLRNLWLAWTIILFHNVDIIFCDQISISIPILRLFKRVPVIFYCHFPDKLLSTRTNILKSIYRWPLDLIEELTTACANVILANSQFTRATIAKAFSLINNERVKVLYPGVHLERYDADYDIKNVRKEILNAVERANQKGGAILVSINRFERKKTLNVAVEALAWLVKNSASELVDDRSNNANHDNVKDEKDVNAERGGRRTGTDAILLMCGGYDNAVKENVEYFDELKSLAKKLNVDDRVTFIKSFSDDERAYLLRHSTILLYTPANEHFGIVPVESMYSRLPVVACSSGGPCESVVDGVTGRLCDCNGEDFGRNIRHLIRAGAATRRRMGREGRKRVEDLFSLKAFANHLDQDFVQPLLPLNLKNKND